MIHPVRAVAVYLLTAQLLLAGDLRLVTGEDAGVPSIYLGKVEATPAFFQSDPRANFPNGGRDYCCPTAISNSIFCLARQGYDGLAPFDGKTALASQIDLINTLASPDYCSTNPVDGTGPAGLLHGVRRYVSEKGYLCQRLEYEGWRSVGRSERAAVKAALPDLAWIKSGISNPKGAVWLNVGWYVATETPGEWKRTGGHWVTLVGYGTADGASFDPDALIIRNPEKPHPERGDSIEDPAKRADLAADVVHLTLLTDGEAKSGAGPNRSLAGMYRVAGPGLPMNKSKVALLDGAVVLVVGSL